MEVQKFLYAIHDVTNDEVIWNARGGAYHDSRGVLRKINRLKKENPDNEYRVLCRKFAGSARVKMEEKKDE